MTTRKLHPEAIKDAVIARLSPTYTLFYTDRNDALSDDQIAVLLRGANPWESKEFADFDDYVDDQQYRTTVEVIKEVCEGDEYASLDEYPDLMDEVRSEIQGRDDSDPLTSVLRQTNAKLFRYDLGYVMDPGCDSWEDSEVAEVASEMAEAAGLDASDVDILRAMRELIYNSYAGGRFYVIWCGDAEQAVELASAIDGTDNNRNPGTVTFSKPHLLILNRTNGSGHEVELPGNLTLEIKPGSVSIDAAHMGPGYTWTDTAGPSLSAYRTDVTITRPVEQ